MKGLIFNEKELYEEFNNLFSNLKFKGDIDTEFNLLKEFYSEEDRHYHNLLHIQNCLSELKDVEKRLTPKYLNEIKTAILYHDIIYNQGKGVDEELSAGFAYNISKRFTVPMEFAPKVSDLILITKHKTAPVSLDEKLIVDIDLSILGKDPETYNIYASQIRHEYSQFTDRQYKAGRIEVLSKFLGRENIFSLDYFRDKYEAHAERNMKQEIMRLAA